MFDELGLDAAQYLVEGGDWEQVVAAQQRNPDRVIVVNMGPTHPSTHGLLRLVLELDGETVLSLRPAIGYLHSGIEKTFEYRSWAQGPVVATRAQYVAGIFNEAVYSLAVDKLLGITDAIPERANVLRVLMMEVNRIASHLLAVGSGGMEIGATSVMEVCLRERERCLEFMEALSGLRMNNAYIRPGGVAIDLPADGLDRLRELTKQLRRNLPELAGFTLDNPIFKRRTQGVAYLDLTSCMALGVSGPTLRATGYPWDLRKTQPYCGYQDFEFNVCTADSADAYGRWVIRLGEMDESVRILEQCITRLEVTTGERHSIDHAEVGAFADLAVGADGQGQSFDQVRELWSSMESLIHHFKKASQGFKVPAGQVYQAIEAPGGELGCHMVSAGGTRPYRVHLRDPGFNHIQALPMMTEGGMLSDIVMAISSLDPVVGGVDR
ncbi:MAG: NADH-quinone oxidoreductase subunit D [Propionibacteriaceae bacterium]|nr:NADH-quinone oxidoreductase subunit D [Propionibacteriaceae bacterium]